MELVSGKSSTSVPLESAMSQLVDFSPVRRAVVAPGHKKWPPSVSSMIWVLPQQLLMPAAP